MSLVNDALKKARLEAARSDAANRSVPYPALGHGEHGSSSARIAGLGALVLVLLAGIGGVLLFRAGKQSALRTDSAVQARGSSSESSSAVSSPQSPAGPNGAAQGPGQRQPAATQPPRTDSPALELEPAASEPSRAPADPPAPQPRIPRTPAPAEPTSDRPRTVQPEPDAARSTPEPSPASQTRARAVPERVSPPAETSSEPPGRSALDLEQPATAGPEEVGAPVEYLRSADIPGIGPIELGGIAWSGDRPFALLNGQVVRPGDSVAGLMVKEIRPNTVHLGGKAGDLVFKLK